MATISELEKQIADLDSKLKYGVGYKLKERNEALEFTRQQIQKAEAAGDAAKVERETRILGNILQEVSDLNGQVSAIQSQKDQLQQELNNLKTQQESQAQAKQGAAGGATSAGNTVAASDDAGVVNPAKPPEKFSPEGRVNATAGTNADAPVTTTNADGVTIDTSPDKKITETQIPVKPPNVGEIKRVPNEPPPDPLSPPAGAYGAGVGAAGDDATPTKNLTRQDIELNFNEDISPQPNILDEYASYTYQISMYLLSATDYRRVLTRNLNASDPGDTGILGGQLLMQSGGENQAVGIVESAAGTSVQPSRNPYFTLDYYIESLNITNLLTGHGTGSAHNFTEFNMTVIEPHGISLIDRIKQAAIDYAGLTAWQSAVYCLVIRWIGYDENGNIVYAGKTNSGSDQTDPYAIAIKYVPFIIKNIKFSVNNRLTTYDIQCSPVPYMFRLRQTVPFNMEITGKTVAEILGGQVSQGVTDTEGRTNTNTAAAGAPRATNAASLQAALNAASGSTNSGSSSGANTPQNINTSPAGSGGVNRGLMTALNQFQQDLVKQGEYEIADEFYIEFVNPSIANAVIRKQGDLSLDKTPMSANDPRALLPETAKVFNMYRNFGITAGQSVTQVIEMVIRNSSYITEQQLKFIDEETQQERPNGTAIENFAWFKIGFRAEPNGLDRKRNDYAYKFYFTVNIFEVKSMNSVWFPRSRFRGVHKSYPYWFTGRNTAILDYQQSFDNLYLTVVSGNNERIQENFTSSLGEIPRYVYQPRSGQSSQGADEATNEPAANAADYLYSPTDLGTVKVKILGDPAWIQQGEIYRGNDPKNFNFSAFNADGSINFESQEILFEIAWQRPVDYDLDTDGLMNPNRYFRASAAGDDPARVSGLQSYVFYATRCHSEFRQGRFEQTLEGGIYIFPRSKQTKVSSVTTGAAGFPLTTDAGAAETSVGTGASGFPLTPAQSGTSRQGVRTGRTKPQVKTGTGASGFGLTPSRATVPSKPVEPGSDFTSAYSLRNRPGGAPRVQTGTPPIGIGGREF